MRISQDVCQLLSEMVRRGSDRHAEAGCYKGARNTTGWSRAFHAGWLAGMANDHYPLSPRMAGPKGAEGCAGRLALRAARM